MAKFTLDSLKPKIIDVEIPMSYGEPLVVPLMTLTYTEYHNVEIGLPRPEAPVIRQLVNGKHEDKPDTSDPDYIRAVNQWVETLKMRRVAKAMEKGGVKELQGLDTEQQIEVLSGMDRGVLNALANFIEKEANQKTARRFQPVSADGDADL